VSKISIKARPVVHRFKMYRIETGFSMLEAVVVVGVLLALAVGGFFAYGPIAENAKKAKVKSAASEIHTAVLVASSDGDSNTKPQDVIDAWNGSTGKIRVEILEPIAGGTSANGDFCVSATNVESPYITARAGACSNTTSNPIPDMDGDGIPNDSDPDIDGDDIPNGEDTTPNGNGSDPDSETPPIDDSAPGEWSSRLVDTNYILDPRFETNTTAGWGTTPKENNLNSVVTSISIDSLKGIGGSSALKVGTSTITDYTQANTVTYRLPVPGVYTKFSMSVSADFPTNDRGINAVIVNYRGGSLVSPRYSSYQYANVGAASGWKQMNLSIPPTIPGDVLYLIVRSDGNTPRADHAPSAFYIDNMLMNTTYLNTYFDGDSSATGEFSYEWTGIPNESISQKNTTRQVSAPSVVTLGEDFQVWGRGYPPNIEVNVYDDEYYSDIYAQTDSSGNFKITMNIPPSADPEGGMDPGPGYIYVSAGSGTFVELEVTLQ
jgi:type II secretory pathway pseudopilin PulG